MKPLIKLIMMLIFPSGSYVKLLSVIMAVPDMPKSSSAHCSNDLPALYSSHHDWAQAMAEAFICLFSAVFAAMENIWSTAQQDMANTGIISTSSVKNESSKMPPSARLMPKIFFLTQSSSAVRKVISAPAAV